MLFPVVFVIVATLVVGLFLVAEVVSAVLLRQFCAVDALFFEPGEGSAFDDGEEPPLGSDGSRLERAVMRVVPWAVEAMDRQGPLRGPLWAAFDALSSVHLALGRGLDALLRSPHVRGPRDTSRRLLREMIQSHRY